MDRMAETESREECASLLDIYVECEETVDDADGKDDWFGSCCSGGDGGGEE